MNTQLIPPNFAHKILLSIYASRERPTMRLVVIYLTIATMFVGLEWWAMNGHYSSVVGGPILGAWFVSSIAALNFILRKSPPGWSIAGVAALISFVDLVFCVVIAGSVARMAAFFLPWTSAGDFNYSTGFMVALEYVVYLVFLIAMVIAARGWFKYSSQAHRAQQSQLEVERGRADVAERDRELVRAELAVLRAQIEPHFLWNTLAQVQYLTRKNPQDAEKMTGHLISYLRAAVPQTPGNMTTLGSEVESVRAYLELMKIRMGARLTATVELEPNLSDVSFPPRLIQTLVENAIRHGIEPKVGAVFVTVTVSADTSDGARIVVQVVDNGVGLQAEPATRGTGLGLRSVRDRLNLIYGSEAALAVSGAPHGGTISRIEVPLAKEMD